MKRIDIRIFSIKLYYPISLAILIFCTGYSAINLNVEDLLSNNFSNIRGDYIEKDVSVFEQIIPILLVYPLTHLFFLTASGSKGLLNIKSIALLLGILFIGVATGGRQTIFQVFIIIIVIRGNIRLLKASNLLFLGLLISLASLITLGRFENPDVSKAGLLEGISPVQISEYLKVESNFKSFQDIGIEVAFYFGHQIPAFCNKIENLDFTLLPNYPLGMQPFIERQIGKTGLLNYTQSERYDEFLALANDSGFFSVSWSTGFLDIYFNLGIIGSFFFFIGFTFLLFTCYKNLLHSATSKYRILQAFNVLFIITFFMTPAFFDTTIFFTYAFIFLNKIE